MLFFPQSLYLFTFPPIAHRLLPHPCQHLLFSVHMYIVIQSLNHVELCDPKDWSTPVSPVFHYLLEFVQTHVHWVGDAIQPSHPLSPSSPPVFNLSRIRIFFTELALPIRWPKYWSFSFSISPASEYSGFISFRIDWFHLLAVQGILKSPLQHHSWKASILWHSAFFVVQLLHP